MVKIKYGWELVKGNFQRVYEESFATKEKAVEWVNKMLKEENGEDVEQYNDLTEIEMNVYEIFGDTGAEIEY